MKDLGNSMDRLTTICCMRTTKERRSWPRIQNITVEQNTCIDIRHHFVRERVVANEINVVYCPTEDMVADVMTKILSKYSFQNLRNRLGVHEILP